MIKKPDVQIYEIHTMGIKKTGDGYVFEKEMKRRSLLLFFIFFSAFWNGVTWATLAPMVAKFSLSAVNPEVLLLLLHPTVGLGMLYFTLVIAFNKYKLVINDKYAETTCGPFPWKGNFKVNRSRISQVYVEQYISFYKNDEPIYRFSVKAISLGGNVHSFVMKGLQFYEEALVIEKSLEELWGIEDRKVKEEYQEFSHREHA